jgi:hypothetical protein
MIWRGPVPVRAEPVQGLGSRFIAGVYIVLSAAVLAPILCVRIPSLGDYLNHLARVHILLAIGHSPALQRFYENRWHIMPYLGFDVPVAGLAHFTGIYTAGRIFAAVCVVMPVLAAGSLHYALYRRIGLVPALAFLLSYNYLLALGFLAYLFAASLAVMAFAGWIAASAWPRWRRGVLFVLPAVLVFLSHSFAFLAYGLLILAWECGQAARRGAAAWRVTALEFAAAGLQAVLPVALTLWLRVGDTFGGTKFSEYGSLADRIGALLSPLYFPGGPPVLVFAFVAVPLLGMALSGWPRLAGPALPPLLAVTLGALAMPHFLLNIWGTDLRLPIVVAMVLIGAAAPRRANARAVVVIVAVVAALVSARAASAAILLRRLDAQIARLRQVVAALPQAATLLVVDAPEDAPGRLAPRGIIQHMSLVAAIDRDAFLPTLFAGTTPLQLLPALQPLGSQGTRPLTLSQFLAAFRQSAPGGEPASPLPGAGVGGQMYWLGWPHKFDYVLIMRFGSAAGPLPPVLHQVAGNDVASLYRVAPSHP